MSVTPHRQAPSVARDLLPTTQARRATAVYKALTASPRALTVPELMTRTSLPRAAVEAALGSLERGRHVERATLLGGRDAGDVEAWRVGLWCVRRWEV